MNQNRRDVVVITGASAGIGRATALEFGKRGAAVALLARNEARLKRAAAEVSGAGGKGLPLAVDVSDAQAVEAAAARVEDTLGPIDIWINCAMVTVFSPVAEMTAEEFKQVTEVTYLGAVYGTLAALRRMQPRNRGSIVQCGSALAYRAIPLQSAYCGAKFAIRGFTDSLRVELMHDKSNVRITMVQLSAFNTPQFQWARSRLAAPPQPVPPIYQPELAARALVFAAHHDRREWRVGFPAVKAIFANKIMPRIADHVANRSAFDGQMAPAAAGAARVQGDNLFATVGGDFGSHGPFDDRAQSDDWQWRYTTHRRPVWGAVWTALFVMLGLLIAFGLMLGY